MKEMPWIRLGCMIEERICRRRAFIYASASIYSLKSKRTVMFGLLSLKDVSIKVAFDDIPEDGLNIPLRLEKVANEVTYRRMKDTLIQLSKGVQQGASADLVPILFGERSPTKSKKDVTFTLFNSNLDHSQAMSSKDVFLLHGPPGPGKTTTAVELILQVVKRGSKILACAASNIAVDNIVERLVLHRVKLVRMGHPARLLPQVLDSAVDVQVLRGDNSALAKDIRKEIKGLDGLSFASN